MNAIPTMYAGVQFRSRLEAKWAAFFDLLKWPWEYEPIDLAGYIPDFILMFREKILVEVKPELELKGLDEYKAKIERSGWDGLAMVVGAIHFPCVGTDTSFDGYYPPILGALWHSQPVFPFEVIDDGNDGRLKWERVWDYAPLFYCRRCETATTVTDQLSWHCAVCGESDPIGDNIERLDAAEELWREAGNIVQWKGAR